MFDAVGVAAAIGFLLGAFGLHFAAVIMAHVNFDGFWNVAQYYIPLWSILRMTWEAWSAQWWGWLVPFALWLLATAVSLFMAIRD